MVQTTKETKTVKCANCGALISTACEEYKCPLCKNKVIENDRVLHSPDTAELKRHEFPIVDLIPETKYLKINRKDIFNEKRIAI